MTVLFPTLKRYLNLIVSMSKILFRKKLKILLSLYKALNRNCLKALKNLLKKLKKRAPLREVNTNNNQVQVLINNLSLQQKIEKFH